MFRIVNAVTLGVVTRNPFAESTTAAWNSTLRPRGTLVGIVYSMPQKPSPSVTAFVSHQQAAGSS